MAIWKKSVQLVIRKIVLTPKRSILPIMLAKVLLVCKVRLSVFATAQKLPFMAGTILLFYLIVRVALIVFRSPRFWPPLGCTIILSAKACAHRVAWGLNPAGLAQ